MARLFPVLPFSVTLKPPLPTPSIGVPIDVNATRKTKSLSPRGYYQCGDMNHLVQDCSYYIDVYQLTLEQREELIEDLLPLKNAVLLEEEDFA